MNPTARKDDILTEQLFDETLVYDLRIHKAHRLNRAAGAIWARCDGRTPVADMAAALPALGLPADTGLVEYALGRLEQAQLLEQPAAAAPGRPRMSRRVLLRRLAQAGALGAALPVVSSTSRLPQPWPHPNHALGKVRRWSPPDPTAAQVLKKGILVLVFPYACQ
jgi:hypothetical protein